jgi:tRNA-splicing endonuclease subunit Sen2
MKPTAISEDKKPCREAASREEQDYTREGVLFSYWGVILSFAILSSLLVSS